MEHSSAPARMAVNRRRFWEVCCPYKPRLVVGTKLETSNPWLRRLKTIFVCYFCSRYRAGSDMAPGGCFALLNFGSPNITFPIIVYKQMVGSTMPCGRSIMHLYSFCLRASHRTETLFLFSITLLHSLPILSS